MLVIAKQTNPEKIVAAQDVRQCRVEASKVEAAKSMQNLRAALHALKAADATRGAAIQTARDLKLALNEAGTLHHRTVKLSNQLQKGAG